MTKAMVALGLVVSGLVGLFLKVDYSGAVLFFGLLTCAFSDF